MSERKTPWTPAPWRFDGQMVYAGSECIAIVQEVFRLAYPKAANTRLIAAAPEMAELLSDCLSDLNEDKVYNTVERVRSLLARIGVPT